MQELIDLFRSVGLDPTLGISALVLLIVLIVVAGIVDITSGGRERVRYGCSCHLYAGDNADCPIAEHRQAFRALTKHQWGKQ